MGTTKILIIGLVVLVLSLSTISLMNAYGHHTEPTTNLHTQVKIIDIKIKNDQDTFAAGEIMIKAIAYLAGHKEQSVQTFGPFSKNSGETISLNTVIYDHWGCVPPTQLYTRYLIYDLDVFVNDLLIDQETFGHQIGQQITGNRNVQVTYDVSMIPDPTPCQVAQLMDIMPAIDIEDLVLVSDEIDDVVRDRDFYELIVTITNPDDSALEVTPKVTKASFYQFEDEESVNIGELPKKAKPQWFESPVLDKPMILKPNSVTKISLAISLPPDIEEDTYAFVFELLQDGKLVGHEPGYITVTSTEPDPTEELGLISEGEAILIDMESERQQTTEQIRDIMFGILILAASSIALLIAILARQRK